MAGGPGIQSLLADREAIAWLRSMAGKTRRLGSICTGAFALAEAGLLNGRRAATHWQFAAQLAKDYPLVQVDGDAIFIRDHNICTSAGVTAGMDLALGMVEEDLGKKIALETARMLVLYLQRPGGQSQYSSRLQAQGVADGRLTALLDWLAENYHRHLTVEALAEQAVMSPRTFARVFVAETGLTPGRYLEQVRMEEAVRKMEQSGHSVDAAAQECGFSGAEHLRQVFRKNLGVTPREYCQRFRLGGALSNEE